MNTVEFNELVEQRCTKIGNTLMKKAAEYAQNDDRLHNFNRAAQVSGGTRERALHGMLMKHFISYLDMLDDIDSGKIPRNEMIDEKIGDIINYFILFEASVKDRNVTNSLPE